MTRADDRTRAAVRPETEADSPATGPTRRPRIGGPAPFPGRVDIRFAGVAAGAVALLVAVWFVFVGTEAGQRLENAALRGAELRTVADREAGLERLSQISVAVFALAVVAVFAVGLLRRRGGLGSLAAAVMLASVVGAEILKAILPRPELVSGPGWLLRNSFPSGSAAVASAIAVGAFLVAPDRTRWLILPVGAVYAAVIGEAIQVTGWHRLSDTTGSTLLVIAIASAGVVLLAKAGLVQPSGRGRVDRRILNVLMLLASVALLLGTVLVVLIATFPLLTAPAGARRAFLQTAFPLFGAGFTVLALLLFARAVEPFSLGRGPGAVDSTAVESTSTRSTGSGGPHAPPRA